MMGNLLWRASLGKFMVLRNEKCNGNTVLRGSARTIGAAMGNDESYEEKESKGKEEEDYELLELCESFQLETE